MLVLSPAAAALVVLVVGVPVLCQAEIKLFIWYYENRFFKDMIFIINQITYLVAVASHHPHQVHQYYPHCFSQLLSLENLSLEYHLLSYLLLLMILLCHLLY